MVGEEEVDDDVVDDDGIEVDEEKHRRWQEAERAREAADIREEAKRARWEAALRRRRPDEWDAWEKLQPVLQNFEFGADEPYGFRRFLLEVRKRPSPDYVLGRRDKARGWEPGNMLWVKKRAPRNPAPARENMSPKEAAAFLGVSKSLVCAMLNRGELPGSKVRSRWVIKREDLERYLRDNANVRRKTPPVLPAGPSKKKGRQPAAAAPDLVLRPPSSLLAVSRSSAP